MLTDELDLMWYALQQRFDCHSEMIYTSGVMYVDSVYSHLGEILKKSEYSKICGCPSATYHDYYKTKRSTVYVFSEYMEVLVRMGVAESMLREFYRLVLQHEMGHCLYDREIYTQGLTYRHKMLMEEHHVKLSLYLDKGEFSIEEYYELPIEKIANDLVGLDVCRKIQLTKEIHGLYQQKGIIT